MVHVGTERCLSGNSAGQDHAGNGLGEMGFRRSSKRTSATREWARFVAANRERFQAAGLPVSATRSIDQWDDLLMHGRFDHHVDPAHFEVRELSPDQYAVLVDLTESYFAAGYEYFTPSALKEEDQDRLRSRFG